MVSNSFNQGIIQNLKKDFNIYIGKIYTYSIIAFTTSTSESIQDSVDSNNKAVYNILTDNGEDNSLSLENDKIYFLDETIKINDFKSENTISTPVLYGNNIKSNRDIF